MLALPKKLLTKLYLYDIIKIQIKISRQHACREKIKIIVQSCRIGQSCAFLFSKAFPFGEGAERSGFPEASLRALGVRGVCEAEEVI